MNVREVADGFLQKTYFRVSEKVTTQKHVFCTSAQKNLEEEEVLFLLSRAWFSVEKKERERTRIFVFAILSSNFTFVSSRA